MTATTIVRMLSEVEVPDGVRRDRGLPAGVRLMANVALDYLRFGHPQ